MAGRGYAIIDGERVIPKHVRQPKPLPDQAAVVEALKRRVALEVESLRKMPEAYDLLRARPQVLSLESVKL